MCSPARRDEGDELSQSSSHRSRERQPSDAIEGWPLRFQIGRVKGIYRIGAPAKDDLDGWKKVQALYANGFRFFSYRSFENCPRLPERFRDVDAFVRAYPNHPFRVADLDERLHPSRGSR